MFAETYFANISSGDLVDCIPLPSWVWPEHLIYIIGFPGKISREEAPLISFPA